MVVQQEIEEALPQIGPLPRNIELAHHNAVEGKDHWGPGPGRDGVVAQIIVGRTAPSPIEVEKQAEALAGVAIERHAGWYNKASMVREMADGTFRPAESDRHPNDLAEAIRWQIAEGQLVQIIGRARGVNRTKNNPVDILVMTTAPLSIPVERLISAADLDPSPAETMMAAGGVSFESPADAATAYPDLWNSRKAATSGIARFSGRRLDANGNKKYLITECIQPLSEVTYQRAGAGRRPAIAYVDPGVVPDPEFWLTERLGPLAHFALTTSHPPNEEVIVEAVLEEKVGGYGEGLDPAMLFPRLLLPANPMEGFRFPGSKISPSPGLALPPAIAFHLQGFMSQSRLHQN